MPAADALAVVPAAEVGGGAAWSVEATAPERFLVWAVHFARFFPFPPSPPGGLLKPAKRSKIEAAGGGTWLKSARSAALHLLPGRLATVVVVLNGKILEEHFLSCLNFSWPRVACAADCPMRGSRVVFASFKDSGDQVQKFAMRFPTSCEAQTFLDAVMVSSKGLTEIEFTRTDLGSETSSQSEHMIAYNQQKAEDTSSLEIVNVCHDRATPAPNGDISSLEDQNVCYDPVTPASNGQNDQVICSLQSLRDVDVNNRPPTSLPPSFTDFLTECSHENDAGLRKSPKMKLDGIEKQKQTIDENDLVSQIQKYVSDSAFADKNYTSQDQSREGVGISACSDMLFKVERVIDDLGAELCL